MTFWRRVKGAGLLALVSLMLTEIAFAEAPDVVSVGSVVWLSTNGIGRTVEIVSRPQAYVLWLDTRIVQQNADEYCARREGLTPGTPKHRACAQEIVAKNDRVEQIRVNCQSQTIGFGSRGYTRTAEVPFREDGNEGFWRSTDRDNYVVRADDLYRRSCALLRQLDEERAREEETTRIVRWAGVILLLGVIGAVLYSRRGIVLSPLRRLSISAKPKNAVPIAVAAAGLILAIAAFNDFKWPTLSTESPSDTVGQARQRFDRCNDRCRSVEERCAISPKDAICLNPLHFCYSECETLYRLNLRDLGQGRK
jgi:hypothetical protein